MSENQTQLDLIRDALDAENSSDIRALVRDLHPADLADILESLPLDQRNTVWEESPINLRGETLSELSQGVREGFIEHIDNDDLAEIINTLDIDDIADLIPELPDDVIQQILFSSTEAQREGLDEILSYADDTAGGLMDVEAISIKANVPLSVVQRYMKLLGKIPQYTDKLYVVNKENVLIGAITTTDLLVEEPSTKVRDILTSDIISFRAHDSDADVASAFERYNLVSAPVVNEHNQLIGRVTIDDVVDVIREQATHSLMAQAGLRDEEDAFAPVLKTFRSRAVWLGVNLVTAIIASLVISQFEEAIAKVVALAVLMPIIASMGGNAGTQTMTFMIRGLATGTISQRNISPIAKKEILVSLLNGLTWAIVAATIAIIWYQDYQLGFIVAVAMMINLFFSAIAGVFIPFILDKIGIDPALASGVALTTVTDVVGFFAILGLASWIFL